MDVNYISLTQVSTVYKTDLDFLGQLIDRGILNGELINDELCLSLDHLPLLEKFIRFHYDLNINLEGMEVIHHLLAKIDHLYNENIRLNNSIRYFQIDISSNDSQ